MKDKLVCIRNSCASDSTVIRMQLTSVLLLNAINVLYMRKSVIRECGFFLFNLRFTSATISFVHSKLQGQIAVHHIDFITLNKSYCGSDENLNVEIFQRHMKSVCDCCVLL